MMARDCHWSRSMNIGQMSKPLLTSLDIKRVMNLCYGVARVSHVRFRDNNCPFDAITDAHAALEVDHHQRLQSTCRVLVQPHSRG